MSYHHGSTLRLANAQCTNTLLRLSASAPLENCNTWSTSGIMLLPLLSCMLSLRQLSAAPSISILSPSQHFNISPAQFSTCVMRSSLNRFSESALC